MPDHTATSDRTVMPIAVGFYLLAVPLVVAIFVAEGGSGRLTNGIAAAVMIVCGLVLHRGARGWRASS